MPKRRAAIGIVCSTLLIAGTLLFSGRRAEPTADEKPLRFWVLAFAGYPETDTMTGTSNALQRIGTNALPFLLHWIHNERAPWRAKAVPIVERLPPYAFWGPMADRIYTTKREKLADATCSTFRILGPQALAAMGELSRLMNDPTHPETAARAAEALCYLGTNALPHLIPVLENPQHPCRFDVIASIGEMPGLSEAAPLVVPAIISCLGETNATNIPVLAAQILAELNGEPRVWIPAVVAAIQSNDSQARLSSARVIAAFANAPVAVPALTNALADTNPEVRYLAQFLLHQIAPQQFTNVPAPPFTY